MCDDTTDRDLTRRQAAVFAGGAMLAAALPAAGDAAVATTMRRVSIATPDGTADAAYFAPAKGRHPAVLIWPDIYGLRPAMEAIGKRLAENGYVALVVNPFYRSSKAPTLAPGATMDASYREKIGPMRALLTPDAVKTDANAYIAWLDTQREVDTRRGIGTAGYCMGGGLVIRTAAAVPGRVKAGASLHGGTLAGDTPTSPHLLIPQTKADFLIAVAENDDQKDPGDKDRLRVAFVAAGRKAEIEVYADALHGWCAADSKAYNPPQAERAFQRMLALYKGAL